MLCSRSFHNLGNRAVYGLVVLLFLFTATAAAEGNVSAEEDSSRITDEVLPLRTDSIPKRPRPILELGDDFFAAGPLRQGITLPTGAVWNPSFIVFGTLRTAAQTFDDSEQRVSEWASRFDVFGNLYLSSTERILIGLRPLDKNGRFSRYTWEAPDGFEEEEDTFEDEFNSNITTLFFEGDFGELFPFLDPRDRYGLDFGIAVGRQPISFQDGLLINDSIDSLGISKINLKPSWAVNLRTALLWGWDELNRANLAEDDSSASLFGVFNEIDFRAATVELDAVYVEGEQSGDGWYGGIGSTQRLGEVNSTLRVLGSLGVGEETIHNQDGLLVFAELSRTLHGSKDFIYLNGFWGLKEFRSASRAADAGGPLGAAGVLFASVGLGRYQAALSNQSDEAFGGVLGYQLFFNDGRTQLLLEAGGRSTEQQTGQRAGALGARLQQALGRRLVLRLDGFGSYGDARQIVSAESDEDYGYGARCELLLQL